jgi:hypothetical protein
MRSAEPWVKRIGVPESFVPGAATKVDELPGGRYYGMLSDGLRTFLDEFAGALPDAATAAELSGDIQVWTRRLRDLGVPEREQAFGHRPDLTGRGQVMAPAFVMTRRLADGVEGTVSFGRYYLGGNGAVHGGAIALFFDEVLGRLSDTCGRPPGRTARLTTTYRAVTPVGRPLDVRAWFFSESGRKRVLRGEVRNGSVLCAEAEGLFVSLVEGQG